MEFKGRRPSIDEVTLHNEFTKLMQQDPDGLLRTEAVLKSAESPASPLHEAFEWDDTEAAHRYRLEQARRLIKSYTVVMEPLQVEVRALTSLDLDRANGGGFRWTTEVLQRPDLREQLIQTALRELQALQTKYAHLHELSSVWATINETAQANAEHPAKAKAKTKARPQPRLKFKQA